MLKDNLAAIAARTLVATLALALAACGVRSISDSGYRPERAASRSEQPNPLYKGELSEFAALGIDPNSKVTEEEIESSLQNRKRLSLRKGTSIMLLQSGAISPDPPMVKALERYYNVSVFTGQPQAGLAPGDYSRLLRLTAAKAGAEKIVVYWGLLETAQKGMGTKTVSWIPVVGSVVPDETQRMRILLRVAVVDVATGQWDMFTPEPFEDSATSSSVGREASDQGQVALLKKKAYEAAAEDIVKRYAS